MPELNFLSPWKASLAKLLFLLIFGAVTGWIAGLLWPSLTIVLGAYLIWHLVNLYRLHRWITTNRRFTPPQGWGIWSEVFGGLYLHQNESRRRKHRLLSIVREFREATTVLPDGVIVLDSQWHIQWFNRGASDLLGLHKTKDPGRPITHLLRDPSVRNWLDTALESNADQGLVISSPDNIDRRIRLRVFSYANGQKLMVARNITELQRVEAMRKDFVANVSHELRTPLTVITGYLETMAGETNEEWLPIVQRMEKQSNRMRAIVEDLLTLSRLDASDGIEQEELINGQQIIADLLSEARMISDGKHQLDAVSQPGLMVSGNREDLRSAFINLVSNAVRYTPPGGKIVLRWESYGRGGARFVVSDNGPGIAQQHIPRLTERFYRISTDRSRQSGGTGLGLAIVKNILVLHQAVLEIQSEPGTGSEFRCIFPQQRISEQLPQDKTYTQQQIA